MFRLADFFSYTMSVVMMTVLVRQEGNLFQRLFCPSFTEQLRQRIDSRLDEINAEIMRLTAARAFIAELWREDKPDPYAIMQRVNLR